MLIKAGSTSVTIDVQVVDDSGLPVTGKAYTDFNTAFTQLTFSLGGTAANNTSTSYATLAALTSSWSSGGIKERAGGWYRLDIPDAMVATAGTKPRIIGEATGYHLLHEPIEVVAFDPADAVHLGLSSLPNAAANASGGLYTLTGTGVVVASGTITTVTGNLAGSVGSVTGSVGSVTGTVGSVTAPVTLASSQHVIVDSGTVSTLTTLPAIPTNWLTAAGIAATALNGKGDWSTYAGGDTSGTTTLLSRIPGTVQPQTGDSYAIVNSATFGNAKLVRATAPATTFDTSSVAQSGDAFAIVNSATYGNAKLVRATTPATTFDTSGVAQTGDAYAIVSNASYGNAKLVRATVPGTTLDTSSVAQTGDAYARIGVNGAGLTAITPPTAAAITAAVWNEVQSGHTTAGTFGKYLDAQVSTAGGGSLTTTAIADAVWDELLSGHTTAGSSGNALATASSGGVDPSVLADAIWDELASGHVTTGSFGVLLTTNLDAKVSTRLASSGVPTRFSSLSIDTSGRVDVGSVLGVAASGQSLPLDGSGNVVASLAANGVDAVVIESGINLRQAQAVQLAAAAGKLSGAATTSIVIKGANTSTTRIAATVDSSGDRSAVTLTLPT